MMSLSISQTPFPPLVTIIDDERSSADVTRDQIENAGFKTKLITDGAFERIEDLLAQLDLGQTSVLCDHRLRINGLARFDGAEFISKLYDRKTPGVLLTQFDQDSDSSIRLFRRGIPSMLLRKEITPESLVNGLNVCWNELHDNILPNRRAHRSLVEIIELSNEGKQVVADSIIPSWDSDVSVRFPLKLMSEDLARKVEEFMENKKSRKINERIYLIAKVNIGAEKSEDIFLEEFEEAPDVNDSALDGFEREWKEKLERAQRGKLHERTLYP